MEAPPNGSPCGGIGPRLLLFLAIIFACLALGWMLLLPPALVRFVGRRTGFGVELQTFYVNPFTANAAVRGLAITNPPGFPRKEFIDIREFRASARLFSLFGPRPVIDDAMLDVASITVVKDAHGVINVRAFEEAMAGSPRGQREPAAAAGQRNGFLVRRLQVHFDRLVVADYSRHMPAVREFDLNFNHTYENVTSARQLAAPLAVVLIPVADAVGSVLPETGAALRGARDKVTETGRKTGGVVKGFFEALEKTLKR